MANFLRQLQTGLAEIPASQRSADFERYLASGLAHLRQAHLEGFADPQRLRAACADLIEALSRNRRDIRPCLALAYLFSLLGGDQEAEDYLIAALQLEPDNAAALELQGHLAAARRATPSGPAVAGAELELLPLGDGFDCDELYDQTRTYLLRLVKRLMQDAPLAPTLDREERARIQAVAERLRLICGLVRERLALLDRELDVTGLWDCFRPLETRWQQAEGIWQLSERYYVLHELMQEQTARVAELAQAFAGAGPVQQASLIESLLDQADRYADQLDAWEVQGYAIDCLLGAYRAYVKAVEQVQDRLDD